MYSQSGLKALKGESYIRFQLVGHLREHVQPILLQDLPLSQFPQPYRDFTDRLARKPMGQTMLRDHGRQNNATYTVCRRH